MTLAELKYILAVAREGHFGRAASACFVSQPTLSVAVRKLEEELGVTLFERGTHDVRITPIGAQIIAQAQKVMEEVNAIKDLAEGGRQQLKGVLRLGAIYTIGPYLFPYLIPQLQQLAPEMPLEIKEDFTGNFRNKLRQGEVDVVILSLPFTETGILTLPLYDEPFVVLMPAHHPLSKDTIIDPDKLAKERLLLLGEGHCFRDQVLQACPNCLNPETDAGNLAPTTVAGSSLETIRHMIASGMGCTVIPATAASASLYPSNILVTRHFKPPVPKRTIALAWRSSFPRPQVIDVLVNAIKSCQLAEVKYL